jgi:lysozyme
MAYNLGIGRLSKFKKMIAALDSRDYELAAKEMLDSTYAKQVKGRAKRNAHMMETGEWFE